MDIRHCGIEPVGASLFANHPNFGASPFASNDEGVPLAPTKSTFVLEVQP